MKKIFIIISVILSLPGCSKKDSTLVLEEQEIVLSSKKVLYSSGRAWLPIGIEVGVWIAPYDKTVSSTPEEYKNMKFTVAETGSLLPATSLRLKEGTGCTFFAYAPYKPAASDPESIRFTHGEDVLGCTEHTGIEQVRADQHSAQLSFVHLTAQIRFVVVVENGSGLEPLGPQSVIRVTGFLPEGILDLSDVSLTGSGEPSDTTDVTAAATRKEPGKPYQLETESVCFFTTPSSAQTFSLRVTHNDMTYTGTITAEFHPGESLVYTLHVGTGQQLSLEATLNPWTYHYDKIEL